MRSRKSSCTIDPPLSETTNFPSSIFRSTCNIFVVADDSLYSYPEECASNRKRIIRKKSAMFTLRDGVMFFKKKKKGEVTHCDIIIVANHIVTIIFIQVIELRFIRTRKEQLKILKACHMDQTSGHMGVKKTINRISARFFWTGIVADVKKMVRIAVHYR